MIVTKPELAELEAAVNQLHLDALIRRNPHLLLPSGFDEVRYEWMSVGLEGENWKLPWYRQTATGTWYCLSPWTKFFGNLELQFQLGRLDGRGETSVNLGQGADEGTITITPAEVLGSCRKALSDPQAFGAVVLPNLWLPPQQNPRIEIVEAAHRILEALRDGHASVSELTWPQLEDIVAELLRARGLQVTCTPRSADGGRDLIARGELIPGEPSVIAVEVKQRGVVRLDDVRSRLYANREFPALLFVTSGRFSAGVIREKNRPDNFLRLCLKDGIGLRQWIDEYHNRPSRPAY